MRRLLALVVGSLLSVSAYSEDLLTIFDQAVVNDPLVREAEYTRKAERLKTLSQSLLWDERASFFKVRFEDGRLSDAREAIGFILPPPEVIESNSFLAAAFAALGENAILKRWVEARDMSETGSVVMALALLD